nr:MAG TPA: hypothetical protein [Caudoviricetes sp.]
MHKILRNEKNVSFLQNMSIRIPNVEDYHIIKNRNENIKRRN